MSAKKVFFAALLGMWWNSCPVQAQNPYAPVNMPAPLSNPNALTQPKADAADEPGTGLSRWITYDRPDCCNGAGGGPTIGTEIVFRIGPSFPIGGEFFGRNLNIGWTAEGGGRALFFNGDTSAAWAVELGITNTYNQSHSANTTFIAQSINQNIAIQLLDRTFVNLALGKEWFVGTPANSDEPHLRFGADVGGRFGSATVGFNEVPEPATPIHHRTQVIEGTYAAIHTDLEIPCGRITYVGGVRGVYGYTFSNIFATHRGDLQDLMLLFNLGVRF